MADREWGDNYRGGYGGGIGTNTEGQEVREAASTFTNYVGGTVQLVFMVFFVFALLAIMTLSLMGYARYLNRRKPKYGFYRPPEMLFRYPNRMNGTYSTLSRGYTTSPEGSQMPYKKPTSTAAISQATVDSHKTAHSSML